MSEGSGALRLRKIVRLAIEGLRRTPLRFTLTALGVTIACGALVSMVSFALGLQARAEAPFRILGLLNNIEVTLPREDDDEENEVENGVDAGEPPILDDAALERIASLPNVEIAYPDFRFVQLTVKHGDAEEKALSVGLPREVSFLTPLREILAAGDFFSQEPLPEAVLGNGLARELGFEKLADAIGETITVEASGLSPDAENRFSFERREFAVRVVGVYEPPALAPGFADGGILLPVDMMKEIPGIRFAPALQSLRAGKGPYRGGYSRAMVRVRRPSDLAPVAEAIEEMGFRAREVMDRIRDMRAFFVLMDVLLAILGTVALVVAALGIINTLLMSVLERTGEIGIYKAIGASDGDVRILFLTEAGLVGLVGGVAGLVLARAVSWVVQIAVNAYARRQGVDIDLIVFTFPLWLLLGAVAFSIGISILAGVYPATRAARIDPIRALRGE
jgi:putative ABC transport system permease protein